MQITSRLKRGIREPEKIIPFVVRKLFPNKTVGHSWYMDDGVVLFTEGGYLADTAGRPEFAAMTNQQGKQLIEIIGSADYDPTTSLEVGPGYGRLSPWVGYHTDEHIGVEPNEDALENAQELYPDFDYRPGTGQDLPVSSDKADLVVTWTVLQHVPDDDIQAAADEIGRASQKNAVLVLCECTNLELSFAR